MKKTRALVLVTSLLLLAIACGGSSDSDVSAPSDGGSSGSSTTRGPDNTGQACTAASTCYPGIDAGAIQGGAVQCLTKVSGGYCTHLCKTDADCCATPGECKTSLKQVCSPFESTGQMMCFLSCEGDDVEKADGGADGFCHLNAATEFNCRSSGGGSKNRKICAL